MVGNIEEISKIADELEDFKSQAKFFGSPIAISALTNKTPTQWCESYCNEHPKLHTHTQDLMVCVAILTLPFHSNIETRF